MSFWVALVNDVSVSLFGSVLSASFCGVLAERRKRAVFMWCMALLLLLQGVVYVRCDAVFLQRIYPLVVHLPLAAVLCLLTRRVLWPVVSVLTAYLCCQLRRWVALFAVALLSGGETLQNAMELAITLPLLLLLLRHVTPTMRELGGYPPRALLQIGAIPALYYGFDYLTRVYTDLLQNGDPAAVEFMPFVCCAAYLGFLLYRSGRERTENQLQQAQKTLNLQLTQAVREIDALQKSQEMARRYRHDLRHHLQYLSALMENGQTDQAQAYISGICREIEAQKVQRYCENEAANLILSAFAGRAKKDGIEMRVQGVLPAAVRVSDSDLCVLLSNALENALHACQPLAAGGKDCVIDVQLYERGGRIFLQVTNPCGSDVRFEDGIPVSGQPDHGVGVQSMCAIARRYGGVYDFLVHDGLFIVRMSI